MLAPGLLADCKSSIPTGQWSLPKTLGKIYALFKRGRRDFEIRK